MTLNLVRRSIKGAPLTAADHDGNLNKLESAIEAIDLSEPEVVSTANAGLQPATSYQQITYASTINLDLQELDGQTREIILSGELSLTTTNLAKGRKLKLRIVGDGLGRSLGFPVDWKFQGAKPATLPANKVARLAIECFGTTNVSVDAVCSVQQ